MRKTEWLEFVSLCWLAGIPVIDIVRSAENYQLGTDAIRLYAQHDQALAAHDSLKYFVI